ELLDGLPAPVAQSVRAVLHLGQGLVDRIDQVSEVVDQRQVPLPLEGGRACVRVFLVEGHLAGQLRLVGAERGLLELEILALEVGTLGKELNLQLLDLRRGEWGFRGHGQSLREASTGGSPAPATRIRDGWGR